jgi:hypothetical protein
MCAEDFEVDNVFCHGCRLQFGKIEEWANVLTAVFEKVSNFGFMPRSGSRVVTLVEVRRSASMGNARNGVTAATCCV